LIALGVVLAAMTLVTRHFVETIVPQLQLTKKSELPGDENDGEADDDARLHGARARPRPGVGVGAAAEITLAAPAYIRQKKGKRCFDCSVRSNRHENLFPCGRFGISFFLFEFRLIIHLSVLVLIALFWHLTVDIKKRGHGALFILWVIEVLLFLAILFFFLPVCVRKYMVITNVPSPPICRSSS
jgi:hypothetical protein